MSEVTAHSLQNKILFIQHALDPKLRIILNADWGSEQPDYRKEIRDYLGEKFSAHFSLQEQAWLADLNRRPIPQDGHLSISHCRRLGGFCFSQFEVGFDVEEISRISVPLINRTAPENEKTQAPRPEFLWSAKEAGFKALSDQLQTITQIECTEWQSHFENQVFSFRLKSSKTLDLLHNKGFIFSDSDFLFAVFFK